MKESWISHSSQESVLKRLGRGLQVMHATNTFALRGLGKCLVILNRVFIRLKKRPLPSAYSVTRKMAVVFGTWEDFKEKKYFTE